MLGALLLVLAGARMEPLREDNFDFGLLGPGWLAVALFVAIGLFEGMLLVALAGRAAGGRRLFSPLPRAGRAATAGRVAVGRARARRPPRRDRGGRGDPSSA